MHATTMAFSSKYSSLACCLLLTIVTCSFLMMGCSLTTASNDDPLMMERFHRWMAAHNRSYSTAGEKRRRFEIYASNVRYMEARNAQGLSYKLGENAFTDQTTEEFNEGCITPPPDPTARVAPVYVNLSVGAPPSVDWRKAGAVTPVRSQWSCRSCWAFATVAAVEGAHKIGGGSLVDVSPQQLVDCDVLDHGCDGGLPDSAFNWIMQNGGISYESDYPYTGLKGKCEDRHWNTVQIKGYYGVAPSSEASLMNAVAQQPVVVLIDTRSNDFHHYTEGVFAGPCGTNLDHAATVVGYGQMENNGDKYWIVKNSWGTDWGDGGYILMKKDVEDRKGLCGIAMYPSFPEVEL